MSRRPRTRAAQGGRAGQRTRAARGGHPGQRTRARSPQPAASAVGRPCLAGRRFAVPMAGAHVRRVFDERCRPA